MVLNKILSNRLLLIFTFMVVLGVSLVVSSEPVEAVTINDSGIYWDNRGHDHPNKNRRVCNYKAGPSDRYGDTYPESQRFKSTASAWVSPSNVPQDGGQVAVGLGEDEAFLQLNSIGHYCTANMRDASGNDLETYQDNYPYSSVNLQDDLIRSTSLNTGNPTMTHNPAVGCSDDPGGNLTLNAADISNQALSMNWTASYDQNLFYVKPGGGDGPPQNFPFSVSGFSNLDPGCYRIRVTVPTQGTTLPEANGTWQCTENGEATTQSGSNCPVLSLPFTIHFTVEDLSDNAELTVNTAGLPGGTAVDFASDPHAAGDCGVSFTVTDSILCTSSGGLGIGWHDHGDGAIGGTIITAPAQVIAGGKQYLFSHWTGDEWADGGEHCAGMDPNQRCVNVPPEDPTNTSTITAHYELQDGDEGIRSITGRKVDDSFSMNGPWSDNKVTIKRSGRFTSEQTSISNPFGFFNLELTTYTVSVEEEPNHSVRWAYCPLPGDGTPNSPKPDGTCQLGGQSTKGDGAVFTASLAANSIEVRFIFTQTTFIGEEPERKVFGANVVEIAKKFLRDNERFEISFKTYIWPDAGIRGRGATPPNGDGRRNLWLAGIWGVDAPLPGDVGDNANDDNSWRANPNVWTRLNWVAELDCTPGFFSECLQRVPAAYVPKDDGSGTPNTAERDGSKTPEGNKWQPIRDHSLNEGFEERLGGIASDLIMDVGGRRGNYINNIEISNIHIGADGIKSWKLDDAGFLQGRVNNDLLQPDAQTLNLPGGSHGPQGNAWDNIREPSTGLLEVKNLIPDLGFSNEDITSYNGLPNFVYNPQAIAPAEYGSSSQLHADMSAVSLLQDGRGPGGADYTGHSEPLTYTATVERLGQARLHWDEYTEWTQVDNKGHWYTSRSRVPTGLAQGGEEFATATLQDFDQGSSEFVPQTCTGWKWNSDTQSWESYTYDCSYWTSCSGSHSYATGWYYVYNSTSYFEDNVETRYGWLNNNPARTAQGSNWTTSPTHFFSSTNGREGNATPPWALTGNDHYWQDTAITDMSNDASSVKPPHDKYWIHDETDPTYTGRHVYNQTVTPGFPVAWRYSYSTSCKYPNGGGAFDSGTETVGPYYPNPEHLYEDTGSASGIYHGKYGADATFDGNSDGIVDSGWAWSNNYQRVRYEQTYEDHHRKLGPRWRGGDPEDDDLLYGTDPNRHILAGRDFSNIYNPTVDVRNADVFAGGNLHSFFQTSQAQSAFLFSNNNIIQFSGTNQYPNYFINDNRGRVDAFYPNDEDPIAYIFRDINELEAAGATTAPTGDSLERGGPEKGDNVWVVNGDLTLGGNNFSGVGTIIVRGNLFINGNIGYNDAASGSNRRNLASLGVIVDGHIIIDPGVNSIAGSYFSSGAVHTGSVLMSGVAPAGDSITWTNNNNRTDSDGQLVVNGLMIARNFFLARNPSGQFNAFSQAESFRYDGRVVVNPPPGFARIFNADAIWNDTVPRN